MTLSKNAVDTLMAQQIEWDIEEGELSDEELEKTLEEIQNDTELNFKAAAWILRVDYVAISESSAKYEMECTMTRFKAHRNAIDDSARSLYPECHRSVSKWLMHNSYDLVMFAKQKGWKWRELIQGMIDMLEHDKNKSETKYDLETILQRV